MKKVIILASFAALLGSGHAHADPTFLLGGGFTFGNGSPQFAITGKVLSNDEEDEPVAGLGLNYYPGSGEFGADLGLGYLFEDSSVILGYDFLSRAPLISFGYADTDDGSSPPPVDD